MVAQGLRHTGGVRFRFRSRRTILIPAICYCCWRAEKGPTSRSLEVLLAWNTLAGLLPWPRELPVIDSIEMLGGAGCWRPGRAVGDPFRRTAGWGCRQPRRATSNRFRRAAG